MSITAKRTCFARTSCSMRSVSLTPPMRKYSTATPALALNIFDHSSSAPEADAEYHRIDCWAPAGRASSAPATAAAPPAIAPRREISGASRARSLIDGVPSFGGNFLQRRALLHLDALLVFLVVRLVVDGGLEHE